MFKYPVLSKGKPNNKVFINSLIVLKDNVNVFLSPVNVQSI